MARLAWLNAHIEDFGKPRVDMLPEGNLLKELPPVRLAPHLLEYFLEMGPSKHSGMGELPLDWTDIDAYISLTGFRIAPHELVFLKYLSAVYVGQAHRSKEATCPAPFFTPSRADSEDAVRAALMRAKEWPTSLH